MHSTTRIGTLALSIHLALATFSPAAFAQGAPAGGGASSQPIEIGAPTPKPGADTIVMKNGGILRGTLVDVIPGAYARIQLATGEISKVPWEAVLRVERGDQAGHPAAQKPPSEAPPAAAPPPAGSVWVRFNSPGPVTLEGRRPDGIEWRPMCVNECTEPLPRDYTYRVVGPGMRNSAVFRLDARDGEATYLTVDAASKSGFALGIVGMSVGAVSMMVGVVLVLVGSVKTYTYQLDYNGSLKQGDSDSGLQTAGLVTLLIGAGLTTAGIIGTVNNARSKVHQSSEPEKADQEASVRVRGPEWATRTTELSAPRTTEVPILRFSF